MIILSSGENSKENQKNSSAKQQWENVRKIFTIQKKTQNGEVQQQNSWQIERRQKKSKRAADYLLFMISYVTQEIKLLINSKHLIEIILKANTQLMAKWCLCQAKKILRPMMYYS